MAGRSLGQIRDLGKLSLFVLILLGLFALRASDKLDAADFRLFLGIIIAYLVGNGVQAIRGKAPSPVLITGPGSIEPLTADQIHAAMVHYVKTYQPPAVTDGGQG